MIAPKSKGEKTRAHGYIGILNRISDICLSVEPQAHDNQWFPLPKGSLSIGLRNWADSSRHLECGSQQPYVVRSGLWYKVRGAGDSVGGLI